MQKPQPVSTMFWSAAIVLAIAAPAAAQFRELANRVPHSANAMVLLNVEKILQSPKAVAEDWKDKVDKAFEAGLSRIPPKTLRYVVASQIDFESMQPRWEAAVADFSVAPTLDMIADAREGTHDKIGNVPAVVLPADAFILQLAEKTLGALAPANRQEATRWIRQLSDPKASRLSQYLQKGASYSDNAGTEVIMVLDLDGVFPPEQVLKYLKTKKALDPFAGDRVDLAKLIAEMEGIRVGVRIGEKLSGRITLDFDNDASKAEPFAKAILLEALADAGMRIEDLDAWTQEVKGTTISLSGEITGPGLRKLLSIVESPASAEVAEKAEAEKPAAAQPASPGDQAARQAQATLRYFKSVNKFLADLKNDMRDLKTMGQAAVWCDKYARKIEKLPMLEVDPEMLDYGNFVATSLRGGALNTRNTNIQAGAQSYQTQGTVGWGGDPYYYGGYGYGRGVYGGGWYGGPVANRAATRTAAGIEMRSELAQKRTIRNQAQANIAGDLQSIKAELVQVTNGIRRKMTDRYKIEF